MQTFSLRNIKRVGFIENFDPKTKTGYNFKPVNKVIIVDNVSDTIKNLKPKQQDIIVVDKPVKVKKGGNVELNEAKSAWKKMTPKTYVPFKKTLKIISC